MPPHRPKPSGARAEEALLRRQVVGFVVLATVVGVLFVGGLGVLYQRSRDVLETELGLRLRTVATTTAATVPGDSLQSWLERPWDTGAGEDLEPLLRSVQKENDVSRILVFGLDRRVLHDTSGLLARGDRFLFLPEEQEAVASALAGEAAWTPLRREGDVYLKAAYAPVFFGSADLILALDELERDDLPRDLGRGDFVAGFVGVLAHPRFFDQLDLLRRSLIGVGVVVLGLLATLVAGVLVYARRLARARAALLRGETLASMGRMAAGIAHEIRNPLGIIKNSAQLLRRELFERGEDTDLVDFIPEEIDRLDETLTGYLDFAREAPLRLEEVDLSVLLRRTLKLMEVDLERAGVRSRSDLDDDGSLVLQADPRRLQQVFLNLLLNAVQAMPEGGTLELSAEKLDGVVRLRVGDDGQGIEARRLDEIFEPFSTSREKGSGLGLFIVRRIVEEHHGRIDVDSEPGRGTTFTLELPLRQPPTKG